MRKEKFTAGIVDFYNNYFNNGKHEICYVTIRGMESQIRPEIEINQREIIIDNYNTTFKDAQNVISATKEYDVVVCHSFFLRGIFVRLAAFNRALLKKIVWIEWGYDLYDWHIDATSFGNRVDRYCGRVIRTKCNAVVAIFPPDIEYYNKRFPKAHSKVLYAPYCSGTIDPSFSNYSREHRIAKTLQNDDPVYIQIGNRATNKLRHIETLKKLEQYKDENIVLFIPLSYGEKKYADKVQKYAETHFPGKTIVLRDFMPYEEYSELLRRVDIAIFNSKRQIALGNIQNLIFSNVKLYMRQDGYMFEYFKGRGVPVFAIDKEEQISFEEFISDFCVDEDKFLNYIEELRSMEIKVKLWNDVYEQVHP